MPKIKIKDVEVIGHRVAVDVELDTGEKFRYVTTTNRTEAEIKEILLKKYEKIQEMKTPAALEKIAKLKKMKGEELE